MPDVAMLAERSARVIAVRKKYLKLATKPGPYSVPEELREHCFVQALVSWRLVARNAHMPAAPPVRAP